PTLGPLCFIIPMHRYNRMHVMNEGSLNHFLNSILRKVAANRPTLGFVIRRWPGIVSTLIIASAPACGADAESPYTIWAKGPPSDPGFFPLAVWLQAPAN